VQLEVGEAGEIFIFEQSWVKNSEEKK